MFIYLILILIFIIWFLRSKRLKVKLSTFKNKGFKINRGHFGVYCYYGKQGYGKTYSMVEFLLNNSSYPIYGNIKSINNKKLNYTYFNGFDELLKLRDKSNCIIVYDEIFTALTKSSRLNSDVLDFLSQMRKRNILFITSAQEWLEIPMTFRRYCRFSIECRSRNIPFIGGILIKHIYDAEQMRWSNLDNEYVAPIIATTISKYNVEVSKSYDTFEQIKS